MAQTAERALSVSTMVFTAFPEANTVRRISRDIGPDARTEIEATLPFRIHFQELGKHNLHVAFRGPKPVGLLYVRSEQTEWGIADIGWALSLECRVLGFAFANSRSQATVELPASPFGKTLLGCNFQDLVALHEAHAEPAGETDQRALNPLARTVLRSAMKATLVTDLVWQDEVGKLADLAMLYDELPGAKPGRRHVAKLLPEADAELCLLSLHAIEARGQAGYSLGKVVRTRARLSAEREVELRWVLDTRNVILRVNPSASWPNEQLSLLCSALRGKPLADPNVAGNPLTQIARELSKELARIRWSRQER